MERESIDIFYMKMAYLVSTRSTCLRRKVGSVIVKDKIVLGTGYNGSVKGMKHCTSETCFRKNVPSGEKLNNCAGAHSEQNAICQAACKGVSIEGATLYCTTQPCTYCAKAIVNSGIKRLVFCESYGNGFDDLTKEILQNIQVDIIDFNLLKKDD
jgi:dCMP deaminase